MKRCEWMFHTVNADGQMFGYNYPPTGMGPSITADEPCATVENAAELTNHEFTRALSSIVTEHCGDHYTPVFQGRGWTVELRSDYPLWTTTS
ncbi:hypothetical protein [Streptomyces malaysiensis]|uniref:Uncharacterized protein n=1 Tax=Streptomyces malaysiensis subsp. samsunensis TaxID=459658 RepID=A0A9X2M445_STRMQ|nr:hypothetical protein [Streptomyces samsunensis]MCQ8836105.1 hypothetical protein [Streptomyces samsunensis]